MFLLPFNARALNSLTSHFLSLAEIAKQRFIICSKNLIFKRLTVSEIRSLEDLSCECWDHCLDDFVEISCSVTMTTRFSEENVGKGEELDPLDVDGVRARPNPHGRFT